MLYDIKCIVDPAIEKFTLISRRVEVQKAYDDIVKQFTASDIDNHVILKEAEKEIIGRFSYRVEINQSLQNMKDAIDWISVNLAGLWVSRYCSAIGGDFEVSYWFEEPNDLVYFKLHWA